MAAAEGPCEARQAGWYRASATLPSLMGGSVLVSGDGVITF